MKATLKQKAELINKLIDLGKECDSLWEFHPNNPNKTDVVKNYNAVKSEIDMLEEQIKELS